MLNNENLFSTFTHSLIFPLYHIPAKLQLNEIESNNQWKRKHLHSMAANVFNFTQDEFNNKGVELEHMSLESHICSAESRKKQGELVSGLEEIFRIVQVNKWVGVVK